jgi:hypothetical protein
MGFMELEQRFLFLSAPYPHPQRPHTLLPTKHSSAMPLPLPLLPAVGGVTAAPLAPATAAPAAPPLRYRPARHRASPSTASSPSTSAVSSPRSPPSARHSRKHLAGRGDAPARPSKDRVFLLDVNPICFRGSQRSLGAFARWLALFFSHVSLRDPVVAVRTPSQTLLCVLNSVLC